MDLSRVEGRDETSPAEAGNAHLGDAQPRPGEEPAEPRVLRGSRSRDPDAHGRQVLDRPDGSGVGSPDDQRDRRRRGEPEDEPRGLGRRPRAEAKHRLEGGRGQIYLALRQRLRGARLGAGRLDRDRQPLACEVAFGLGHADGQVLR